MLCKAVFQLNPSFGRVKSTFGRVRGRISFHPMAQPEEFTTPNGTILLLSEASYLSADQLKINNNFTRTLHKCDYGLYIRDTIM